VIATSEKHLPYKPNPSLSPERGRSPERRAECGAWHACLAGSDDPTTDTYQRPTPIYRAPWIRHGSTAAAQAHSTLRSGDLTSHVHRTWEERRSCRIGGRPGKNPVANPRDRSEGGQDASSASTLKREFMARRAPEQGWWGHGPLPCTLSKRATSPVSQGAGIGWTMPMDTVRRIIPEDVSPKWSPTYGIGAQLLIPKEAIRGEASDWPRIEGGNARTPRLTT